MDLVRYLQNLKAEDIVKIEVLPNEGSECLIKHRR